MKTVSSRLGTLGLGFALIFFWASSPAGATTITAVTVSINGGFTGGVAGPTIFSAANVGWTFPVSLGIGQDLVLTQNFHGTANDCATPNLTGNINCSYNFDTSDATSDLTGVLPTPGPATPYQIAITADGFTTIFTDVTGVLSVKGQGSVATNLNEAQIYTPAFVGPGYLMFLGYADSVHGDACGAYATSLGLFGSDTCFPAPFSTASVFQGTGGLLPDILSASHCGEGQPCYEGGVIRILSTSSTPVPEPATVTLLLTGLAGLTARRYGQARKRARDKD